MTNPRYVTVLANLNLTDRDFVEDQLAHGYRLTSKRLADGRDYYELTPPTGFWRRLVNWLVWR